nr:NADP-specific glutamate dehydrogenase [Providencia stuartii]
VSGSGNVAVYAIDKAYQLGALPVTASDSSGYVVDDAGIDLALLRQIKEVERGRISEYAARRPGARFVEAARPWEVPGEVAVPAATQNELDEDDARTLIAGGVRVVSEGANMPC